ncbi:MAG TPA: xanthine dehydrogenase family protein molybdopterin-binding subunit [Thermoplasmata archaeon]|nr:xanthine dehydrogenase family protein molybdopterin-binding subunit [Thermoplasmata archaeon]
MTRPDAAVKLTGAAAFGTDLEAPGMLWAALVGSPVAHGRVAVDVEPARRLPGVVAAVGPKELRDLLPKGGGDPERPIFPTTAVYRHQPVAAIAARSLREAREAARAVVIEADPLPIISEIEDAFPEWPATVPANSPHVIAHVHARFGAVDEELGRADLVHAETYRTSGIHHVAIEPHACLAEVRDGTWRVATTTQSPFGVREDAASLLGIPEERLVVDGTWVGGGFGGKGSAFVEPYALVLASATKRPVKLALTYREEFLLGRSTLPSIIRLETAVRKGAITARRVRLLLDSGASLPGRDFATGFAISFLLGPYRAPAVELEGYAVRTNKPPFGPHRAPFAPQCDFASESHLDGLARKLGADPVDFRLGLVWNAGDVTHLGQPVEAFGAAEALKRARALVRRWRDALGPHQGVGVGVGFWSTGVGAGGEAVVRLTPEAVIIVQGEREIGNGSVVRGLAAVAERVFGLPAGAVQVTTADTASAPYDSGVYGSRTVAALGQAVEKAARRIASTLAERLGATEPARLEVDDGALVALAGGKRAPVAKLLTAKERAAAGLVARDRHYGRSGTIDEKRVLDGTFYPYSDYVAAVHVAQVEVDRETGGVRVLRSAAISDVGLALEPELVRAQLEGATVMGLGTALTEEMLWGPEGKLLNPGLLDYRIPTLGDVPPIETETVEGHPGAGSFGLKGLGEPPMIPVAAAVANAVADATGARLTELPLTAERVARALKLV